MGKQMVLVRTPLRVSLFGGGTDFYEFYQHHGGAVISTAINRYVYVTAKRHPEIFEELCRINYSSTDIAKKSLDELNNSIARAVLNHRKISTPLYLNVFSDLPFRAGLGSSSSFTVGLLHALDTLFGRPFTAESLAEDACRIEIDILGEPIGKQDQYAAAVGGANLLRFSEDNGVEVERLNGIKEKRLNLILSNCLLVWTGITRNASDALAEQKREVDRNTPTLKRMGEISLEFYDSLSCDNYEEKFVSYMRESWKLKQKLSSSVSSEEIEMLSRKGMSNGADCCKLLGAGAGGFILFHLKKGVTKSEFERKMNALVYSVERSEAGTSIEFCCDL